MTEWSPPNPENEEYRRGHENGRQDILKFYGQEQTTAKERYDECSQVAYCLDDLGDRWIDLVFRLFWLGQLTPHSFSGYFLRNPSQPMSTTGTVFSFVGAFASYLYGGSLTAEITFGYHESEFL